MTLETCDVVVIGAGAFGAWTAHHLVRSGQRVTLLDAYGPANSRASSGGETRIIRMSYGSNEVYTRWCLDSLSQWKALAQTSGVPIFKPAGMLRLAGPQPGTAAASPPTLKALGVPHERLEPAALAKRFPQIALDGVSFGLYEPGSGVLLARRGIAIVVAGFERSGGAFAIARAVAPRGSKSLATLETTAGEIRAAKYVFACGPWLKTLFPDIVGPLLTVPRAEVFFLGPQPGDSRFAMPAMPAWADEIDDTYGVPDIESRGFKVGIDPPDTFADPDSQERVVSHASIERMRAYVARRFPGLAGSPLVETRVCQYEETTSGDYILDRHPDFDNVWIAGGGSGHGFKMGPAVGAYVADRVVKGDSPDARFTLRSHRESTTLTVR